MYRKRLRVKTGCLRCKKSKKKCDEERPKCSFCRHRGVACIRDVRNDVSLAKHENPQEASKKNVYEQPRPRMSNSTSKPHNVLPATMVVSSLDPFHNLPVPESRSSPEDMAVLRRFFSDAVSGAIPFDISKVRIKLAQGWIRSMFADTAVYYSLVSYGIRLQSRKLAMPAMITRSLEYETRAVSILQKRINTPEPLSEETFFASALHYTIYSLNNRTPEEIGKIWRGLGLMIESRGGYEQMDKWMHLSTLTAVGIVDTIASLVTGLQPVCRLVRPENPHQLDIQYIDRSDYTQFIRRVGLPAANLLRDLRCVLFFRKPSRQTRALSMEESEYLFRLLIFIDNELGWLQSQHSGSGTLTEVIVMAMIVLKLEVIAEATQHLPVLEAVLQRLEQALSVTARTDRFVRLVSLWACITASSGLAVTSKRNIFIQLARDIIWEVYGILPWTKQDLINFLTEVAWHDRLLNGFDRVLDDNSRNDQLIEVP